METEAEDKRTRLGVDDEEDEEEVGVCDTEVQSPMIGLKKEKEKKEIKSFIL